MMSDAGVGDRCRGVLVGPAAGDRIGGPIRMAVRLAESLLDCGGFDPVGPRIPYGLNPAALVE